MCKAFIEVIASNLVKSPQGCMLTAWRLQLILLVGALRDEGFSVFLSSMEFDPLLAI